MFSECWLQAFLKLRVCAVTDHTCCWYPAFTWDLAFIILQARMGLVSIQAYYTVHSHYLQLNKHLACKRNRRKLFTHSQVSTLPFSLINEIKGSMSYKLVEMPLIISLHKIKKNHSHTMSWGEVILCPGFYMYIKSCIILYRERILQNTMSCTFPM